MLNREGCTLGKLWGGAGNGGGQEGGGDSRWVLLLSNDKEVKAARQTPSGTYKTDTQKLHLYLVPEDSNPHSTPDTNIYKSNKDSVLHVKVLSKRNTNKISPSKLGRTSGTAISGTLPMSGT